MNALGFSVNVRKNGATSEVSVTGDLDLVTAPELSAALNEAVQHCSAESLILDLSGITFMDSSGLRVLLRTADACKSTGVFLYLTGVTPQIQKLLTLAGVAEWFDYA
ncbi:MAG TPA: STAS domain-containing protein [Actinomycetota bacterium]|nr:STAS domain-containing protein [Actinomycetota bacterium]